VLRDRADGEADHRRFIERTVASEAVWLLRGESGVAYCDSNDVPERHVLMLWSDRAYASRAGSAHFPGYEVATIDLFDFLFRWLPGMSGDRVLVGTNWTGTLTGLEVEPIALQDQLLDVLHPAKRAEYVDRLRNGLEAQKKNERA